MQIKMKLGSNYKNNYIVGDLMKVAPPVITENLGSADLALYLINNIKRRLFTWESPPAGQMLINNYRLTGKTYPYPYKPIVNKFPIVDNRIVKMTSAQYNSKENK